MVFDSSHAGRNSNGFQASAIVEGSILNLLSPLQVFLSDIPHLFSFFAQVYALSHDFRLDDFDAVFFQFNPHVIERVFPVGADDGAA